MAVEIWDDMGPVSKGKVDLLATRLVAAAVRLE